MKTELSQPVLERLRRIRETVQVTPEICTQKARYSTESYRETEGHPYHYRRAKALERVLSCIDVSIGDEELIVGRTSSKVRGGHLSPEVNKTWYLDEMDTFSTREQERYAPVSEQDKQLMREMVDYWDGKSLADRWIRAIPDELLEVNNIIFAGGAYCMNTQYPGHFAPDFAQVLSKGIKGLLTEVDAAMLSLTNLGDIDQFNSYQYLKSMKLSLGSIVTFANRYAELAEKMAGSEPDPARRAELEEIARVCRKVPLHPAESFHEAIQSTWFINIGINLECWGAGQSFGRLDQYLYPYYKADIDSARLTQEDALKLLSMFFIKMNGQFTVYSTVTAAAYGGLGCRVSFNIGGIDDNGEDAVNELTWLCLDAEEIVFLTEDVVVLVSEKTPQDFLVRACEVAKAVCGKMKFIGEDLLIDIMLDQGRPLEVARRAITTGCNSPSIPGLSLDVPGGMLNLPLLLELALNDGYSSVEKKQLGPHTGDAAQFSCFEDVIAAFKTQFESVVPLCHLYKNVDKQIYAEYSPSPFQSALFESCVRQGRDIFAGGTYPYNSYAFSLCGSPNVADSLAALKKVVFEDRQFSMQQVLDALRDDFAGHESVLHALEAAPKFGNDLEYVDSILDDILVYCADKVAETPGYAGAQSTVAIASITSNILMGYSVGALPDGRKAGLPLAEGGISPHQGRNVSGPTATLMSVAKLSNIKFKHGSVLNMRFDPEAIKDGAKLEKFAQMLKAFFAVGGFLVQFNIISTDTLKDAQENPDNYRDLLVRVATYSAYFVELSRMLQDDIINRLEFESI